MFFIKTSSSSGRPTRDSPAALYGDLPERVTLLSGRPILVVPFAGKFGAVGERVLVAWRTGRESVRALHGAMPLMSGAKQVCVFGVDQPDAENSSSLAEVCSYLTRHEIPARADRQIAVDISIGDVLLNQAWEEGCDLLVMGAYSPNAQGALTLGPVARHVLRHMTIPVLMSH